MKPCGGLGPACIAYDNAPNETTTATRNHRGPSERFGFYAAALSPCLSAPTQCDPKCAPSPICCIKDHTVPVSNQTTLVGARPLLCPPTPQRLPGRHHQPGNVDIPARPWWGNPAVNEDPSGRPVHPLRVVVLCCAVWLALRMLTSYLSTHAVWPLPPPAIVLLCTQYLPRPATHAMTLSNGLCSLKYLLFYCVLYLYSWLFKVHRHILATCAWAVSSLCGTEANNRWQLTFNAGTHIHIRTCRHSEVVWLHRGSMLEARPSSEAVQTTHIHAYNRSTAAVGGLAVTPLPFALVVARIACRLGRGDNSIRVAPCSMQIKYPPYHRGRFWSFVHAAFYPHALLLGRVSEGLHPPHKHHRHFPRVEALGPAGPIAKVECED